MYLLELVVKDREDIKLLLVMSMLVLQKQLKKEMVAAEEAARSSAL